MGYQITGTFIEACDCSSICPCWLDDEPDDDHCTGLFAWQIDAGSVVEGQPVDGRTVVSVSTHTGGRRAGDTVTALFVDDAADDVQLDVLSQAFAGDLTGPLQQLAGVSGVVVHRGRAQITISPDVEDWLVTVSPLPPATGPQGSDLVRARGGPLRFDEQDPALTLRNTALSAELGIPAPGEVDAQRGTELRVQVPVLPAGFVDVTRRSAMRGRFSYRQPDEP